MTTANWLELLALIAALAVTTPIIGSYLAKIYDPSLGRPLGDRAFSAIERPIYRICGIDPDSEQRWTTYAYSLLAFSLVSVLILYAQLRLQGHLLLNPDHYKGVSPGLAFNTSVSFLTNTNWQAYGDGVMSDFTQMAGLAFHNFVSAAAGAAVAVALIRGLVRRRSATLGQLLGRHDPHLRAGVAAAGVRGRSGHGEPGHDRQLPRRHPGHDRGRGHPGRSPVGPSPARRPSRRGARTAAVSSAPTPPTPSRTPTRSPTSCSCG